MTPASPATAIGPPPPRLLPLFLLWATILSFVAPPVHSQIWEQFVPPRFLASQGSASTESDPIKTISAFFLDPRQGDLYVAEANSTRILVFDPDLRFAATLPSPFPNSNPVALAVDSAGTIYAADGFAREIRMINFRGTPVGRIDLTAAADGMIPSHLYIDSRDHLYVIDQTARRGEVMTLDGTALVRFGIPQELKGYNSIGGLFVDEAGTIYVADFFAAKILLFDATGAPGGKIGRPGQGYGELAGPVGIAMDRWKRLYVASAPRNSILVYNPDGTLRYEFGGQGWENGWFQYVKFLGVGKNDRLYTTELHVSRIQTFQILERDERKR